MEDENTQTADEQKPGAVKLAILGCTAFLGIGFGIIAGRSTTCRIIDNPFICGTGGGTIYEIFIALFAAILFVLWFSGRIGSASDENRKQATQLISGLAATPFVLWLILFLAFGNY